MTKFGIRRINQIVKDLTRKREALHHSGELALNEAKDFNRGVFSGEMERFDSALEKIQHNAQLLNRYTTDLVGSLPYCDIKTKTQLGRNAHFGDRGSLEQVMDDARAEIIMHANTMKDALTKLELLIG